MPQCCGWMPGMMAAMGWWWFVVFVLIVALVAALVFMLLRPRGSSTNADSARDELRARYARGEIAREEYEERDAVLSGRVQKRGA